MNIAIVYDCLYPNTVGGAERWYRSLAERLGRDHSITYLTRRQWGDEGPNTPFHAVAVAPGGPLYTSSGRRSIWPTLRFGLGTFFHLLRHARRYDVIHSASFPYFSLIGAWLALRVTRSRARLIVDWHELWSREYWNAYLGPVGGRIGYAVQGLCLRLPHHSFTFSRLVEERLRELGHTAPVTRLAGEHEEDPRRRQRLLGRSDAETPLVLFAGRHIPEKRVALIPSAISAAKRELPDIRCLILGDGPETADIREQVHKLGLESAIEMRGRVSTEDVAEAIASAACLLNPSAREGYGQVVVEAVSVGTPAIVVAGPDNAATELVEDGVNGFVLDSPDAEALGDAILRAVAAGNELRQTTLEWYERHRDELSIESSLGRVEATYMSLQALS